MGRIAIVGVGHSKFGKRSDASLRELAFEAYRSALDDAELESPGIDGWVVCSATHYGKQRCPAGVVCGCRGLSPKPTVNVEAPCATTALARRIGWPPIASRLP